MFGRHIGAWPVAPLIHLLMNMQQARTPHKTSILRHRRHTRHHPAQHRTDLSSHPLTETFSILGGNGLEGTATPSSQNHVPEHFPTKQRAKFGRVGSSVFKRTGKKYPNFRLTYRNGQRNVAITHTTYFVSRREEAWNTDRK